MIYAENILICIAVPLVLTLLFLKGSARKLIFSFLVGMGASLLSAYIGGFFEYLSGMSAEDTSIFISPVIEEIMKLIPIVLYLLLFGMDSKEKMNRKSAELLIVAVGCGAGFATFENCCYILSSGSNDLSYILIRGAAVGVMHLTTTVVLSMGLSFLQKYGVFSFSGVIGALSLSMTFHGLYNLLASEQGISSLVAYVLPTISILMLYAVYSKTISEKD